MKIDKKKLVDLLAEKTNLDRVEIEKQMNQLIERILESANRGKTLEIKEFGIFYFDEEGELRFEPAKELSTEISYKYAGMQPIELKPERDISMPNLEDKPAAAWEDETDDEEQKTVPESTVTAEKEELPEEPEKEPNRGNVKSLSRKPVRNRRDNTGLFILLLIITLLAIFIAGYFYYVGSQSQTLEEPGGAVTPQIDSGTKASGGPGFDESEDGGEAGQTLSGENTQSAEQVNMSGVSDEIMVMEANGSDNTETSQPIYGLTGDVEEELSNGYSIVLHSFMTEERATSAADQLREDNYRVIVTSRPVNENTVWRVSVGQFESLHEAQQATAHLPEPFNSQNFIQRIQINQ